MNNCISSISKQFYTQYVLCIVSKHLRLTASRLLFVLNFLLSKKNFNLDLYTLITLIKLLVYDTSPCHHKPTTKY